MGKGWKFNQLNSFLPLVFVDESTEFGDRFHFEYYETDLTNLSTDSGKLAQVTLNESNLSYDYDDKGLPYETTYTLNGELKTKTTAEEGITVYEHDPMGNLIQVVLPNSKVIGYTYDAQNRRIAKTLNGTITERFIYKDQLEPIAKLDGDGNILEQYVYGEISHVPSYIIKNGTTYRVISDHLGSVRKVVDSVTGTVAQEITYDEFGNVLSDSNPGFQPFYYVGGVYDLDTKLVKFGARDYDPETGRWLQKEPLGFEGSMNFYSYCDADPINLIDITGLAPGDYFATQEAAAVDAMNWTLKKKNGKVEWGGLIIKVILSKDYGISEQRSMDDEVWYKAISPVTSNSPTYVDIKKLVSSYTLKLDEEYVAYYHTHIPRYRTEFSRYGKTAHGKKWGDIDWSKWFTAFFQQEGLGKFDAYVVGFDQSIEKNLYGYYDAINGKETYWSY